MRKLFAVIALVGVALLALASPAAAWHISDVKAHCDSGQHDEQGVFLHVGVKLSDKGPGTWSDSSGNAGTFGNVKNIEYDTPTFAFPLMVSVSWYTGEHSSSTIQEVEGCEPPSPTTTTIPETTTSQPGSTTTTAAPTTTTDPVTTTSAVEPTTTTQPEPSTTTLPPETTTSEAPTTTQPVATTTRPTVPSTVATTLPPSSTTHPVPSTSAAPPQSTPPSVATPIVSLPHTGSQSGLMLLVGFLMLGAGTVALAATRRR